MATLSGGSNDYYKVEIQHPTTKGTKPYVAECNDIIETLDMPFALGNIFKAIWRLAANRHGKGKPGNTRLYDAEKIQWFANREVERARQEALGKPQGDMGVPMSAPVKNKPTRVCATCDHGKPEVEGVRCGEDRILRFPTEGCRLWLQTE